MDAADAARTTLTDAWPLFGLRIRSERLELSLPDDDGLLELLDLARAGIHPPDEMPFGIAWSAAPSPEFEQSFVRHHWLMRGSWSEAAWTLHLVARADGRIVGTQGISGTEFAVHRTVDTGSWIGRAYQGQGLGKEMRGAILGFAFDGLGARVANRLHSWTTPPRTPSRADSGTRTTVAGRSPRLASPARPSGSG